MSLLKKSKPLSFVLMAGLILAGVGLLWPAKTVLADNTLCTGSAYATCISAGYTAHRFNSNGEYLESHWGAVAGHNCTNYVGYVLTAVNGVPEPSGSLGNGEDWDNNAPGYGGVVNGSPAVGAVAQWEHSSGHQGGHVAYVEAVSKSATGAVTITISQDSFSPAIFYWKTLTQGDSDWPDNFIHFNDLQDPPAMYTATNGDVWLASVNRLSELFTQKYTASTSTWGPEVYHSGGWSAKSTPSIVADNAGNIWLAATKVDGRLMAKYFSGGWQSWVEVEDKVSIDAGVNLVARTNGNVSMALVRADGQVHHATGNTSNWTVSSPHWGGNWSVASTPALTVDTGGTMWIAAVKDYGHLYTWRVGSSSHIMHPDDFSGYSTQGGLDLVARSNGSVSLAAIKANKDFYHRTYTTTNSTEAVHGGSSWSTTNTPAITVDAAGRLWIAALTTGGGAHSYVYDEGAWTKHGLGSGYFSASGIDLKPLANGSVTAASVNSSKRVVDSTWSWSVGEWSTPNAHWFEQ